MSLLESCIDGEKEANQNNSVAAVELSLGRIVSLACSNICGASALICGTVSILPGLKKPEFWVSVRGFHEFLSVWFLSIYPVL